MIKIMNDRKLSKFVECDGSAYFFSQKLKKIINLYEKDMDTQVEIFGTKIHLDGSMDNFKQVLTFPKQAKDDVEKIINEEKRIQRNILGQIKREQEQLPKQFRNSRKADEI